MAFPFFTIGHSDRSLDEFVGMLSAAGVTRVVDIRKLPGSRAHPQFDGSALASSLASFGIGYEHVAALGGLRGKAPASDPAVNGFWTNRSFHHYADYAMTPAFRDGLERLIAQGREQACAMMCAEAVWWRCHRRIVADHLIARGEMVLHLMGKDRIEPARLTEGAVTASDGTVVYPAATA